jgi:hypothetical protein
MAANTDIGISAAKDSKKQELDDFVSNMDSVFGSPEEKPEQKQEEPLTEEPKTTAGGISGAIIRGAAPYVAAGAATAPLGLMGGPFAEVTVPAAFGVGATTMALSDLAVGGVNAIFGTHHTSPKEAITHWLDEKGVPKPESKAEIK